MVRALLSWILPLSLATGAAEEKSIEQWAEELAGAYAKSGGYIARYHAERKGTTFDGVLASDLASGRLSTELVIAGGKSAGHRRIWFENDQLFLWRDGVATRMVGIQAELHFLADFQTAILPGWLENPSSTADPVSARDLVMTASFLLEGKTFGFNFGMDRRARPNWIPALKTATVKTSDAETVTFESKTIGLLTIGRKTGMIMKQVVVDEDGETQSMVLRDLRMHPGKEAVAEISKDWEATTPQLLSSGAVTGILRSKIFQLIVDQVEAGNADLAKVDEQLNSRRDALREIAKGWLGPGPIVDRPSWKAVLENAKKQLKAHWLANVPGAKADDDAALEAYLGTAAVRRRCRDQLAAELEQSAIARPEVIKDLFPTALTSTDEAGTATKHSIEAALVRAFGEAILEKKMSEYWGERTGLD